MARSPLHLRPPRAPFSGCYIRSARRADHEDLPNAGQVIDVVFLDVGTGEIRDRPLKHEILKLAGRDGAQRANLRERAPAVAAQANTVFVGADGKFEANPDTALVQFNISVQEETSRAAYDRAQALTM